MAGRYGDENPNMKYYNDYRNRYYNPDDEINRPGVNVNWKDIQQGFYLVEAKDNQQDGRLDALEEKEAEQDARLDAVEAKNEEQDGRLDAIEAEQETQNNRLTAIEAEQVTQNNRLDAIETEQTEQNGRLDAIETKDAEQDQEIAAIKAKDIEQDATLAQQAENIRDLDTRLTDAEGDIQNENQRNTAQDAAIADNSVRITRIEDYGPRIAVIEAEQVTQNEEIEALKAADQVLTSAVSRIDQKDAAQDQEIEALKQKDTELDGDIAGLDTRISSVEDAIDTRLTAVEEKNAEQDATLSNHETRIADNTARNTAQEQAISDNSARITALRQTVNSNTDRITALEGELADAALPERTTPADPDEARTTVIGDSDSNVTIEAEKTATGESLMITDTANGDAVSVGFTSDANGDNIRVGGNTYKLGGDSSLPIVKKFTSDFTLRSTSGQPGATGSSAFVGDVSQSMEALTGFKPDTHYIARMMSSTDAMISVSFSGRQFGDAVSNINGIITASYALTIGYILLNTVSSLVIPTNTPVYFYEVPV